jgi:hypothetical protein
LFEYKYSTIFQKINTSCHYEIWSENTDFQIVKKQRLTFEFDWKKKGDSTNGTNTLIGTYKENHGWLIERGIVARFSFVDIVKKKNCGKIECPMGNSQKFPRRPRDASEENTREKPDEKKGAAIISLTLPVTSLPIMSFPVRPLPVTSFPVT